MNISSSTSSSSSSTDYTRLTGLATGLDVDGLVKQSLTSQQSKIDKANQDKTYLQWEQASYVDVITQLKTFQSSYLDILGSDDTNMMKSSAYVGVSANVPTDTTAFSVSALPGAIKGSYTVQVNNIAKGGSETSRAVTPTTKLSDIGGAGALTPGTMTIAVGGKTFTVNTTSDTTATTGIQTSTTMSDFVNKLKSLTDSSGNSLLSYANISYSELTNKLTIESKTLGDASSLSIVDNSGNLASQLGISTGTAASTLTSTAVTDSSSSKTLADLGYTAGTLGIVVGGKTFTVTTAATDTVSGLISKINNATTTVKDSSGTSTTYNLSNYISNIALDSSGLTFTAATDANGNQYSMNMIDISGNTASKLGIDSTVNGQNASITITPQGENPVTISKDSNNFSVDNVTYNLYGDTNTSGPVTMTVKADASASVAKIKKFVSAYNTLISDLNSKLSEEKYYDYKPLTDAQKAQMSDSDITAWETKAKSGILRNDPTISSLLTGMRQAVYAAVSGVGVNITDIGITTSSVYQDKGKLIIDENKLTTALETNADQVQKLFTQSGSSTTDSANGILQKFKNLFDSDIGAEGTLIQKAGYTDTRWVTNNELYKLITQKTQLITDLQSQYTDKKQQYYNMYSTLESNMNKLNSQSSWLSQSLG